jgi:hypothetical protein
MYLRRTTPDSFGRRAAIRVPTIEPGEVEGYAVTPARLQAFLTSMRADWHAFRGARRHRTSTKLTNSPPRFLASQECTPCGNLERLLASGLTPDRPHFVAPGRTGRFVRPLRFVASYQSRYRPADHLFHSSDRPSSGRRRPAAMGPHRFTSSASDRPAVRPRS